jgi:tRNA(Ile)-lysidine synthase
MAAEQPVVQAVAAVLAPYSGAGVLGVSGGADSVGLLCAVLAVGRSVTVVHVHHGLRGAEADADEAFVRELCAQRGVAYQCRRIELVGGTGVEAAGRQARYRALAEVTVQQGAKWVAVAHTADDQAETILQRLIRGAGLSGIRGMPAVRPLAVPGGASVPLVRPLLTVRRQQVRAYLQQLGQNFREDSSNRDLRFTRNRIRHELLPLLSTFNTRIVEALQRLGEQASEAADLLERLGSELLTKAELPRAGAKIILDAAMLHSADPVVQRWALRHLWQREGWPMAEMDYNAWYQAAQLCQRPTAAWDFPGGVRLVRCGRVVQLWRKC